MEAVNFSVILVFVCQSICSINMNMQKMSLAIQLVSSQGDTFHSLSKMIRVVVVNDNVLQLPYLPIDERPHRNRIDCPE